MISKSGFAVGKKMKWFLYEQMRFLIPHFSQGKTKSKLSPGSGGEAALEIGRDMSQASTGLTPASRGWAGAKTRLARRRQHCSIPAQAQSFHMSAAMRTRGL